MLHRSLLILKNQKPFLSFNNWLIWIFWVWHYFLSCPNNLYKHRYLINWKTQEIFKWNLPCKLLIQKMHSLVILKNNWFFCFSKFNYLHYLGFIDNLNFHLWFKLYESYVYIITVVVYPRYIVGRALIHLYKLFHWIFSSH